MGQTTNKMMAYNVFAYSLPHSKNSSPKMRRQKTLVDLSLLADQYPLKKEQMNAVKFPTGLDLWSDSRTLESKEVTVDK